VVALDPLLSLSKGAGVTKERRPSD